MRGSQATAVAQLPHTLLFSDLLSALYSLLSALNSLLSAQITLTESALATIRD